MLSACAGSAAPARVNIPPVVSCLTSEAQVPDPRSREDARIVAARERAGRLENADRIRCGREAWGGLVRTYAGD